VTLPHGTDRLESARLVLRRITPDDLPFYTRLHALPEVARHLYFEAGRARPKNRPHGCSPFSRAMSNSRSAISRSCARQMER